MRGSPRPPVTADLKPITRIVPPIPSDYPFFPPCMLTHNRPWLFGFRLGSPVPGLGSEARVQDCLLPGVPAAGRRVKAAVLIDYTQLARPGGGGQAFCMPPGGCGRGNTMSHSARPRPGASRWMLRDVPARGQAGDLGLRKAGHSAGSGRAPAPPTRNDPPQSWRQVLTGRAGCAYRAHAAVDAMRLARALMYWPGQGRRARGRSIVDLRAVASASGWLLQAAHGVFRSILHSTSRTHRRNVGPICCVPRMFAGAAGNLQVAQGDLRPAPRFGELLDGLQHAWPRWGLSACCLQKQIGRRPGACSARTRPAE